MNHIQKHGRTFCAAALLLVAAFTGLLAGCGQPAGKDLKILYVGGTPDKPFGRDTAGMSTSVAERMHAFDTLLRSYFRSVTVIPAGDYTPELSAQYDVTIMDGIPAPVTPPVMEQTPGGRPRQVAPAKYFPDDFAAPVVLIAELSAQLGRGTGLKTDWYCQCLGAEALGWRAEHAIFHKPFPVTLTVQNKPTPEQAFNYASFRDGVIPDSLPMWSVQTKGTNTEQPAGAPGMPGMPGAPGGGGSRTVRAGLVIRGWGLEDSPEAEYISGGVSEKGLNAVAIGRHGNFLHWGFAASPALMTDAGKAVFANAVAYIAQFKGKGVIARKYNENVATREYYEELKYLPTAHNYRVKARGEEAFNSSILALQKAAQEKQQKKEPLTDMEQALLRYQPQPVKTYEEFIDFYQKNFAEAYGLPVETYAEWFDAHRDYLYPNPDKKAALQLAVDEDAKSLGIPNHDQRLLDAAIELLEAGTDTDKAARILARYTLADFATAKEWRRWYNTHQSKLFFTESGGWVFLVNSYAPGLNDYRAREQRRVATAQPPAQAAVPGATSSSEPVAMAADITTLPDGNRQVNIRVKIHPGYQIYDYVAGDDPFIAATVAVALPDGCTAVGELHRPSGEYYNQGGTTVYKNTVTFTQVFSGSGTGAVQCTVGYQCCDARVCFPPTEKTLTVNLP